MGKAEHREKIVREMPLNPGDHLLQSEVQMHTLGTDTPTGKAAAPSPSQRDPAPGFSKEPGLFAVGCLSGAVSDLCTSHL